MHSIEQQRRTGDDRCIAHDCNSCRPLAPFKVLRLGLRRLVGLCCIGKRLGDAKDAIAISVGTGLNLDPLSAVAILIVCDDLTVHGTIVRFEAAGALNNDRRRDNHAAG